MGSIKELLRRIVVIIMTLEARAVLRAYRPKVIAVTGSVGKTSAKDAVYTALSDSFFVRRSEKSYNSDIGVPLTVLGVPNGWSNPLQWLRNILDGASLLIMRAPYPEWLVVEVGADRPGDITKSLQWLTPHVVVATRFPEIPVHVEFYDSPEDVAKEELAPAQWLPEDGILVANGDDERAGRVVTRVGVERVLYGFGKEATLKASRYHVNSQNKKPTGISFDVAYAEERAHVALPGVVGLQHAYSALAGIGVAVAVGVALPQAAQSFVSHESPPGRMRLIPGIRGSTVIDDSYNASPAAVEEALSALSDIPRSGRRIAVLADMLELGMFSVGEHYRIGGITARSADVLVTVGIRAREIARGARDSGMPAENIFECERGADAAARLVPIIGEGDIVLIKGSQSMRMERVVKSLMAEPQKAKQFLVRQDKEWLSRG
ncbi:MAG: UDP-N-acetylmuramoyl-tripeptide--D-alanyl-D-alanine ligase [bacterium]|nr:UDP-N-acetylmuramoyl-tripeptide--D-alanyl-D-alanine ligase [bacterium]